MKKVQYHIWEEGEYTCLQTPGFLPTLEAYLHEDGEERPCVLVVPGGAYVFVSDHEGIYPARRFYERGYQTFILTYTTNPGFSVPLKMQPLKDISRAVRLIRNSRETFHIREDALAVCGFSAGGHLCASLCVHYEDVPEENEKYRGISNRPDAAILGYPVITTGKKTHRDSALALLGQDASEEELAYMSLETQVKENTPPVFLWTTREDSIVPVDNSELFAKALRDKNIPCAYHMFSFGDHGLSTADEDWADEPGRVPNPEVAQWVGLADGFLRRYMK